MSTSQYNTGRWLKEEDSQLRTYIEVLGERSWKKISGFLKTRSPLQCLHRWTKILKPGMIKGSWTLEEDSKLIKWVQDNGARKWSKAALFIKGRNGKQCRERWINHLSPEIKKGEWTQEEDEKLYSLYTKYGSSWTKIAKNFQGRSENSVKNRFYATIRKVVSINSTNSPKSQIEECQIGVEECNFSEEFENSCLKMEEISEIQLNSPIQSTDGFEFSDESVLKDDEKNVMELFNKLVRNDEQLDLKIWNMIDSLKNIEIEIMNKITHNLNEQKKLSIY